MFEPNLCSFIFFFQSVMCDLHTQVLPRPQFQTWHFKAVSQSAPHVFIRDTAINRHAQEKKQKKQKKTNKKKLITKLVASKFKCQSLVSDINSVKHRFSRADDRSGEGEREGVRCLSRAWVTRKPWWTKTQRHGDSRCTTTTYERFQPQHGH